MARLRIGDDTYGSFYRIDTGEWLVTQSVTYQPVFQGSAWVVGRTCQEPLRFATREDARSAFEAMPERADHETHAAAKRECARRNLALAEDGGYADRPMPALDGGRGVLSPYTYREFYQSELAS